MDAYFSFVLATGNIMVITHNGLGYDAVRLRQLRQNNHALGVGWKR